MSPLWLMALVPPIVADPAPPLVVASASPRGVTPALSSAAMLRAVEAAAPAPLVVRTPEQVGLDVTALLACPLDERLSCWTTRTAAAAEDAVLLVLSLVDGADGTSYSGVLIDVKSEAASDGTENDIFARATRFDRSGVPRADLEAALSADVARALEAVVERRDDLAPWGEVEVSAPPGRAVRVDGRVVGVTGASTAVRLRPGARRIGLGDDGAVERLVEVRTGKTVQLDLRPAVTNHPMHVVSAWTGAGVGALGAVVLVASAATSPVQRYDVNGARAESRWVDTCDLFEGCSGGLPLAPLGAALLGAGATAAASYAWIADGEDYAWWWAAIGVGVGVLTYGAMALAQ